MTYTLVISCSVGNRVLSSSEHSSDFALWVGYLTCRLTLQRKYISHVKNVCPYDCVCPFPLVTSGQYITGVKLNLCTSELIGTIDDDDDDDNDNNNNIGSHTQTQLHFGPFCF